MELPTWLKLENIIKNLSLSNWFNSWFKYENKRQVGKEINIKKVEIHNHNYKQIILSPNADATLKIIEADKIPSQKIQTKEFEFTDEEKYLISKVNKVHALCGKSDFSFERNYRQALNHIRNKPSDDWHECVAKDIAQAMQDIDFFNAFEKITDPEKLDDFNFFKTKINYIYNNLIQELRHTNKRGQIEKQFKGPYCNILDKKPIITESQYEDIFDDFQELLMKLFKNFKLKSK